MNLSDLVKLLPVLYVSGHAGVADRLVSELSTAELRQALMLAVTTK